MEIVTPIRSRQVLEHQHPTMEKGPELHRTDTTTTLLLTTLVKKSPIVVVQIEIGLYSSITAVPIVTSKYPVFTIAKVSTSLSSIYLSTKPSHIDTVTIVATRSSVHIVTRAPIKMENQYFNLLLQQFYQELTHLLFHHQFMYKGNNHQWKLTKLFLELTFLVLSLGIFVWCGR